MKSGDGRDAEGGKAGVAGGIVFDPARESRRNTVTRRLAINVGFKCNFRCRFCYYLDHINTGNTRDLDTEEVKRRLRVGRSWGKTAIDFTGGEPTMRRDLPELIAYARSIGYETACIITNGWVIGGPGAAPGSGPGSRSGFDSGPKPGRSGQAYFDGLVDAGLGDILMSLHGPDAKTHDMLTRRAGSFDRLLKAAERASRKAGVTLRFNHVICEHNYRDVERTADIMASFGPAAMNFILFQPTSDACNAESGVRFRSYGQVTPHVVKAIEKHRAAVPHINVRDIPFCLLKGYEPHVKTLCQLQYEKVEWDYCLDVIFKKGWPFYLGGLALGTALCLDNPYFRAADLDNRIHVAIQRARIHRARKKSPPCRRCALTHICDGIVKDYARGNGGEELVPYEGGRIANPTYFMARDEIE